MREGVEGKVVPGELTNGSDCPEGIQPTRLDLVYDATKYPSPFLVSFMNVGQTQP